MTSDVERELATEQAYVDRLYRHLDTQRAHAQASLAAVRTSPVVPTPAGRAERDAFDALHSARLQQLAAVEDRLAFGRLDLLKESTKEPAAAGDTAPASAGNNALPAAPSGENVSVATDSVDVSTPYVRHYIGRLGLSDEQHHQLLLDWRAPAAAAFYQATPAAPRGVLRRRHLTLAGRNVRSLDDEILDAENLSAAIESGHQELSALVGEGALIAALTEHRTGHMRDIVATLQAEQDVIVRSPLPGTLVVQGGPGTGKTAVALHRAAYLLYTHRDIVARSGVLVVGPTPVFLRYIEQVLPSLGETGVVLLTTGQLYPGVDATAYDHGEVAVLKGSLAMAKVIKAAVKRRERLLKHPIHIRLDGNEIQIRPEVVGMARARARQSGRPHNEARAAFVRIVLDDLADQLAATRRLEADEAERAPLLTELRDSIDVRREINLLWMPLTATGLVRDLLTKPVKLAEAAGGVLSPASQRLLLRERGAPWTISDVPLLDEAAELIGPDVHAMAESAAAARKAGAERAQALEYARKVLRESGEATAMMTPELLADRFTQSGTRASIAERAQTDRTWTFAHAVVDEAQELSPMQWRVIARRVPNGSMTVVGDTAQTSSAAGTSSWDAVLDAVVPGRWRLAELTINYRTPARIMAMANRVAQEAKIATTPATSAREGDHDPQLLQVAELTAAAVAAAVIEAIAQVDSVDPGGLFALIAPRALTAQLQHAVISQLQHHETKQQEQSSNPNAATTISATVPKLADRLSVLDVHEAKGLEFDGVVVVDPTAIIGESTRGSNDLYVALTRPTQWLAVAYRDDLPAGIAQPDPAR